MQKQKSAASNGVKVMNLKGDELGEESGFSGWMLRVEVREPSDIIWLGKLIGWMATAFLEIGK